MEDRTVGLLDPVDPATAWNSEPGDFVPWLLQPHNLRRLGDALGLDLEPVAREAPVGRFRADIVCRDRHTAGAVVIEAQLGTSDHSHLGQLLTYADGLDADVVVWLGTRFHDEHRSVVGRLNRSGDLALRCFVVAIDLWKIDASRSAAQFTVLAAPREWPGPAAGTPGHRPAPAEADAARAGSAGRPPLGDSPIRSRRLSRGLSLKQVAKAAGLSRACVAHIETGRNKGTPKTLAAIEYALNMPPGELARDGQPRAEKPETGKRRQAAK
ncbi:MAG: helix-turn-helix domain-containing protein [Defluviicoccus sp.]|nr:helix-turn-helix domain-containing protein [Defluviicoccus sp.]